MGYQDQIRICLQSLAQCYRSQERDSLALVYYQKCIEETENIRGQLNIESQKSSYAAGTSDVYENPILLLLKSNRYSTAFHYSERARARSFLDLLASAQVKVGKPEHQEFLAKENEFADQKDEIEQQISAAGEDTAQVVALRGKLTEEWETALASLEETERKEPELASLVSVNPLTLPEVQKLLDKETTLLEYFLTEEKTLLWLVTRKNAEVFQVDIGGDSLKALVMGFRKTIQEQSQTDQLSRRLYDLLIAPTADKIKTDNLIIVPHGILHYLPFAALQDSRGRYLLGDFCIRYLPSASVLKYLVAKRKGNGERLLALGNPATDRKGFAAIPLTEMEVNEIGASQPDSRVLTGAQATETEFKRLAPQSDILHLACHGDLNSAYPMYSCLLLAPDSVEDGELDVHEIFNLDLHANLVVLSGCQTGLGHLTNGDELVGLSRAFIYAGTPSIVSSLWMVEDESTAYLMGRFYHHLQDQDKAQALRQAQLETRAKYPGLRSWASFVLTGDSM
jgi:CHAT domain-containing protein